MIVRAIAVWFAILFVAIVNGAFRQGTLIPWLGVTVAHVWSTLLLSAAVLAVTFCTIRWISPATASDCLAIGALWVAMTLAFEFLAGHYLFGKSWAELLEDYNVIQGRIWPLVLFVTFFAPLVAARLRNVLAR